MPRTTIARLLRRLAGWIEPVDDALFPLEVWGNWVYFHNEPIGHPEDVINAITALESVHDRTYFTITANTRLDEPWFKVMSFEHVGYVGLSEINDHQDKFPNHPWTDGLWLGGPLGATWREPANAA